MIPGKSRGMYQALQNILHGAGAITGATLGGLVSDAMGWRICFLAQAPVSLASLVLAYIYVKNMCHATSHIDTRLSLWRRLDLTGASLLFVGLVLQLVAMSLGSEMSWSHPVVVVTFVASILTIVLFVFQERSCKATPILPLRMIMGRERVALLASNVALGTMAYGVSGTTDMLHTIRNEH